MDDDKHDLDEHELSELTKEVAKRLERRGLLQAGAGLAAGGAAGYLASGRAEAGSSQTGTIGSGGSPVDVVAEDIYGPGGQGSNDFVAFEAVETANLLFSPQGARLERNNSLQSVADNTVTQVEYDEKTRDTDGFADLTNNQITIPSNEYNYAKVKVSIRFQNAVNMDILQIRKNGAAGSYPGAARIFDSDHVARNFAPLETGWVPVTSGDTFDTNLRQQSGGSASISDTGRATYLEVWAV